MVDQHSRQILPDSFFDIWDVGHHGTDAALLHAVISAGAHAAAQQHLAILDRLCHAGVPVVSSRAVAMRLAGLFFMMLVAELVVTQLIPPLAPCGLTIFDDKDHVVRRTSKM